MHEGVDENGDLVKYGRYERYFLDPCHGIVFDRITGQNDFEGDYEQAYNVWHKKNDAQCAQSDPENLG